MKKVIPYFILVLSLGVISSKQRDDQEYTSFVDNISVDYKIRFLYDTSDEMSFSSEDAKDEFISKCIKYVPAKELKALINKETTIFKWDQKKLKTAVCVSSAQDPRLKVSGDRLFYVSLPRFDKTGNYAVVKIFQRIIYDNPDISYGNIDVYLFQLKNNKWKAVVNYSVEY